MLPAFLQRVDDVTREGYESLAKIVSRYGAFRLLYTHRIRVGFKYRLEVRKRRYRFIEVNSLKIA